MKKIQLALACLFMFNFVNAYTQQDLLSAQYDYQVSSNQLTEAKENLSKAQKNLSDAQKERDKAYSKYKASESELLFSKQAQESAENLLKVKTEKFQQSNDKVNQIWNSLNKSN